MIVCRTYIIYILFEHRNVVYIIPFFLGYCFTLVIRSRMRIYFGSWLRLATDYKSARILRDHNLLKSSLLSWKYGILFSM
ncbi:unnamed protein product [Schistosoma curassoni]|uniref:Ovule protein n=1 Tax=Schistosoma curassoni TaxID=6186 RepID=A0A183KD42_9TREM|nr:unnamed protein product [Schistosoma curassoni]